MTPAMMDEAVRRINCYGVGAWLEQLLKPLGLALPGSPGQAGEVTTPRVSGLIFRIRSLAPASREPDPRDLFYLSSIEGDATAPMPLGLDARAETLASATGKLSQSTVGGSPADFAAGERRVSFFMDMGKVIELRFAVGLGGFDRLLVARLGEPLDWRDPANH